MMVGSLGHERRIASLERYYSRSHLTPTTTCLPTGVAAREILVAPVSDAVLPPPASSIARGACPGSTRVPCV